MVPIVLTFFLLKCAHGKTGQDEIIPDPGNIAANVLLQHSSQVSKLQEDSTRETDCGDCSICLAKKHNDQEQEVKDSDCSPCANGEQPWWPCNVLGLCYCDGAKPAPLPTQAPISAPLPVLTTPLQVTTQKPVTPAPPLMDGESGEDCKGCSECVAKPGAFQAVTNDQCQPCAGGKQTWWPCNLDGLCQCAGFSQSPPASPPPSPDPSEVSIPELCSATGPACTFTEGEGISKWFTKAMFDDMFPHIRDSRCHGGTLLTYQCLIQATMAYPDFASSANVDDNKRELAAWLGQMSQETTGGGCPKSMQLSNGSCSCGDAWCDNEGGCESWGLCFVEEKEGIYCWPNRNYPCVTGKEYKGRGPKQLSYNYNYGQFSEQFCGDKHVLLNSPENVATNPILAWASSMWFWFSGGACLPGEICKPSCHEVFLGEKVKCASDVREGRQYGLGWVTNVVNGGLECGIAATKCDRRVHSRVRFYKHFCRILHVSPLKTGWTEEANLYCANQANYAEVPPELC